MRSLSILAVIAVCEASGWASDLRELNASLNLRQEIIPKGMPNRPTGRKLESPRFITVHSTQTYLKSADSKLFANSLSKAWTKSTDPRSRTGYKAWHFTVDQNSVAQHLPLDEQGDHADFSGPGNRSSIGIEMCENAGSNQQQIIDRTARLVAWICLIEKIPVTKVKMHWHWPQTKKDGSKYAKPCPHFFVTDGNVPQPNERWTSFLSAVERYIK
jgi:N-acetylmuramoyl-L-alanine amidase